MADLPALPSDEVLTAEGLDAELEELRAAPAQAEGTQAGARTLIIACGALAREILAVIRANALDELSLTCLPALLHNRPEKIAPAVREKIAAARAAGIDRIFVAYADCGTGGALDRVCAEEGVARIDGPHCYAFFDGLEAFAQRAEDEIGTFYLTDFLARQFDTLVWSGMGLDRHPELRDMYFAHYDRVVYLAQTENPALTEAARAAADRLGLAFERRFTGYGGLAQALIGARPAPPGR
ncbi:MAG: DUF1638 domain-containing protein [Pseudomonadota bacterium]